MGKKTDIKKPKHFIENLIEDEEVDAKDDETVPSLPPEQARSQVVYNEPPEEYDIKDTEIDLQLQEIYSLAISAYKHQVHNLDYVHPKNKPRVIEACSTLLNVALNAAKEKASLHANIKKLTQKPVEKDISGQSRNELIKQLRQKKNSNTSHE